MVDVQQLMFGSVHLQAKLSGANRFTGTHENRQYTLLFEKKRLELRNTEEQQQASVRRGIRCLRHKFTA